MELVLTILIGGWIGSLMVVSSSLSPYFGALSLMVAAGCGCGILAGHGGSFLSLALFLIYLGGMLVAFAYSAAVAAERFPVGLGDRFVMKTMGGYLVGLVMFYGVFEVGGWGEGLWPGVAETGCFWAQQGDIGGIIFMFSLGAGLLLLCAWVLLITMLVVLDVTRGLGRGNFRAV